MHLHLRRTDTTVLHGASHGFTAFLALSPRSDTRLTLGGFAIRLQGEARVLDRTRAGIPGEKELGVSKENSSYPLWVTIVESIRADESDFGVPVHGFGNG